MRWIALGALCLGLGTFGCGSGSGGGQVDTRLPPPRPDAIVVVPTDTLDNPPDGGGPAGCDEVTLGVDYCIRNPGTAVGGGTPVLRQQPAPYQSCKL